MGINHCQESGRVNLGKNYNWWLKIISALWLNLRMDYSYFSLHNMSDSFATIGKWNIFIPLDIINGGINQIARIFFTFQLLFGLVVSSDDMS